MRGVECDGIRAPKDEAGSPRRSVQLAGDDVRGEGPEKARRRASELPRRRCDWLSRPARERGSWLGLCDAGVWRVPRVASCWAALAASPARERRSLHYMALLISILQEFKGLLAPSPARPSLDRRK